MRESLMDDSGYILMNDVCTVFAAVAAAATAISDVPAVKTINFGHFVVFCWRFETYRHRHGTSVGTISEFFPPFNYAGRSTQRPEHTRLPRKFMCARCAHNRTSNTIGNIRLSVQCTVYAAEFIMTEFQIENWMSSSYDIVCAVHFLVWDVRSILCMMMITPINAHCTFTTWCRE